MEKILLKTQKPAKYTGAESGAILKDAEDVALRFAFCFPDTYEIGMSNLGLRILYSLLNETDYIWCERVFAPWLDFAELLCENDLPLYSLESYTPLYEFDIIGFTLQYELSYTNVLKMLDMGGVPMLARERKGLKNLVIGGGPCACNPEPLCEFFDLFVLGEGEEVILELTALYDTAKNQNYSKDKFLSQAAQIQGVYVPSLYIVKYNPDGTVLEVVPTGSAPAKITKRIIKNLDNVFYPQSFITPYVKTVHDRAVLELMRGCSRGCRFCQAGFIYRPVREKTPNVLCENAVKLCDSTGYEEISLSSLSTGDYKDLEPLLDKLTDYTDANMISLSLPSLRLDNFSPEMLDKVIKIRSGSLTFAPESGTQRLRNVINKNITEESITSSCRIAFSRGISSVKLYFMMCLPTETDEDILAVVETANKTVEEFYNTPGRSKKPVSVTVSAAVFIPKPFTPFQWHGQDNLDEICRKQKLLKSAPSSRKVKLNCHTPFQSRIEAAFSRGDRRLGRVLLTALKLGCAMDSWDECFDYAKWETAFASCGLDMDFYVCRNREYSETLPWDHLDFLISREYLMRENEKAKNSETTPDCRSCRNCRDNCTGCGVKC